MSRHSTTQMSGSTVELGHEKPVFDLGNALNLNVSVPEPAPAVRRPFASRDEAEEFLAAADPKRI
jgi:hypothetical protein